VPLLKFAGRKPRDARLEPGQRSAPVS